MSTGFAGGSGKCLSFKTGVQSTDFSRVFMAAKEPTKVGTAPDHVDHLQAMPAWFGLLLWRARN